MNEITTVGVDLAKELIVVCAADAAHCRPFHRCATQIDNEVRPSTVKSWLTTRRISPLQPTDHRRRLSPSIE